MKALILNNKIVQLSETEFPVAPPMFWAESPSLPESEWASEWVSIEEHIEETEELNENSETVIRVTRSYSVTVDEELKTKMLAKREYDNLVTQAQGMLAGFSGLRENLGLQVEALVRNDSVVLNELRSKFEFAKYLEYRKEVSMSDGLVPILVRNNRDELEIKMVSFGTVPSGMIQVLPFGFGPDDLEFVSYKDGDLKLDLEGRLNKFKLVERDFETARARDEWNEKGIIERFSEAYLGRG